MAALFTAQTTNGSSSAIDYSAATTVTVSDDSTFGGCRVTLEISDDGGTEYTPVHAFSQAGAMNLELNGTFKFRLTLTGASASTSVNATYNGSA